MLCHDWLSSKHVVLGTKTGKVLVLEDAELRSTVDLYSLVQRAVPDAAAGNTAAAGGQLQMSIRERVFSHEGVILVLSLCHFRSRP